MDYIAETKGAVAMMTKETLIKFSQILKYKDFLLNLRNYFPSEPPNPPPVLNRQIPPWVWRREPIPISYRSLEWGGVVITLKSNYWGRKISLFYNRMTVGFMKCYI